MNAPGSRPTRTPKELGQIVRQRRLSLGRTQMQVVEAAREAMGANAISEPTLRAIETGRTNASDLTLAAASRGLDWPPDTLTRLRHGEPLPASWNDLTTETSDPPPAGADRRWAELTDAERTKVEAFIDGLLANRHD